MSFDINIINQNKIEALNSIRNFHQISPSQLLAFENFVADLLNENQLYNFIGKSTINDIWHRHILDSIQLVKYLNNFTDKFADFGSGAGFPGVILSIAGVKEIHLIEKAFRKADFLRKVKNISPNKIYVHQKKLEEINNLKFDCIVSRALAPLDKLLNYANIFLAENGYCLFLKGKNLPQEIILAKQSFNFDYELFSSITNAESNIIKISKLSIIK